MPIWLTEAMPGVMPPAPLGFDLLSRISSHEPGHASVLVAHEPVHEMPAATVTPGDVDAVMLKLLMMRQRASLPMPAGLLSPWNVQSTPAATTFPPVLLLCAPVMLLLFTTSSAQPSEADTPTATPGDVAGPPM